MSSEWWDVSWNFMGGCSECGPGCQHCWARKQAMGRLKNHPLYKGLTENGHWTGEIRFCTDINRPDMLNKPFHWKKPRRIFVADMSDLFYKRVLMQHQHDVFSVMHGVDRHTYLVLTKRPDIMAEFIKQHYYRGALVPEHIWLGVTVCNQAEADEKIPILLQIPASHRFVCLEPLLEKVDIAFYLQYLDIDWVIVGCESRGNWAGRFSERYPEAALSIIEQCQAAGVSVFHKQMPIGREVKRDMAEWPAAFRVQEYV